MAKRTTMNISLPAATRKWVEKQVKLGEFGSASEYIRHLTRAEQQRQKERLEQMLLEGLNSGPATEMRAGDWDGLRQRVRAKTSAARRRKRAG